MATGSRYFVAFRRRREGRTDYYQRTKLVVADAPRMVVRRTNRHIIVQMVIAEMEGDKTLVSANSAELEKYGYTGATANTPAAYLTGLLFAAKAKKAGQDRAILDIGLNRATRVRGSLQRSRVQLMRVLRSRMAKLSFPPRNVSKENISRLTTKMPVILSRMSSRWQPP